MYLREWLGGIAVTRGRIAIAKRIEAGRDAMIRASAKAMTFEAIMVGATNCAPTNPPARHHRSEAPMARTGATLPPRYPRREAKRKRPGEVAPKSKRQRIATNYPSRCRPWKPNSKSGWATLDDDRRRVREFRKLRTKPHTTGASKASRCRSPGPTYEDARTPSSKTEELKLNNGAIESLADSSTHNRKRIALEALNRLTEPRRHPPSFRKPIRPPILDPKWIDKVAARSKHGRIRRRRTRSDFRPAQRNRRAGARTGVPIDDTAAIVHAVQKGSAKPASQEGNGRGNLRLVIPSPRIPSRPQFLDLIQRQYRPDESRR